MATPTHGQDLMCVGCGGVTTQHPLGRPRHYCSTACRVKAHRARQRGDAPKVSAVNAGEPSKVSTDPTEVETLPLFDTPSVTE